MNYFVEGIQGAGKSTLTGRLAELFPEYRVFHEGDHNPVELAWCAYMTKEQYEKILLKYVAIAEEIKANTLMEAEQRHTGKLPDKFFAVFQQLFEWVAALIGIFDNPFHVRH